jgi:hypothetical protein
MSANASPVGCYGRVTSAGAIRPGRLGEVMIAIRGGVEAFLAKDVDGGAIDSYDEVVVVEYEPPRTVLVTRMYPGRPESSQPQEG